MIISIKMSHMIQLKSVYEKITSMYMIGCIRINMAEDKTSILLSDLSIEGDLVEKDKIIIDAKISGDINANEIETHTRSKIKGNITSKIAKIGGQIKGNIASDKTIIKKTADVDGVLNQKTLSIEEGAKLKIKTETNK